jgi:RHS repeat-associated protein
LSENGQLLYLNNAGLTAWNQYRVSSVEETWEINHVLTNYVVPTLYNQDGSVYNGEIHMRTYPWVVQGEANTTYFDDFKFTVESPTTELVYTPEIKSSTHYYPFGMQIEEYSFTPQDGGYRYGFNGYEKDDEMGKGSGNSYTSHFRSYDPRLGRFTSVDPAKAKYPSYSPYSAFLDNPIIFKDALGDTATLTIVTINADGTQTTEVQLLDADKTVELYERVWIIKMHEGSLTQYKVKRYVDLHLGEYHINTILTVQNNADGTTTLTVENEYTRIPPWHEKVAIWLDLLAPEGDGDVIRGGENIVTKDGGASPTKTKTKNNITTTDVTDLLAAAGATTGISTPASVIENFITKVTGITGETGLPSKDNTNTYIKDSHGRNTSSETRNHIQVILSNGDTTELYDNGQIIDSGFNSIIDTVETNEESR